MARQVLSPYAWQFGSLFVSELNNDVSVISPTLKSVSVWATHISLRFSGFYGRLSTFLEERLVRKEDSNP